MLVVVAYDIPDDRRRTKLHTALHGFGQPVQESLFECEVTVPEFKAMKKQVRALIRSRTDNVRYYPLCESCADRIEDGAGNPRPSEPNVFVV